MMKLPHTLLLITYPHSCAALDCPPQWRVDLNRRVSGDTRTTAIPFYNLGMASIVGLWVSKVQGERKRWFGGEVSFWSLRHVRLFSAGLQMGVLADSDWQWSFLLKTLLVHWNHFSEKCLRDTLGTIVSQGGARQWSEQLQAGHNSSL